MRQILKEEQLGLRSPSQLWYRLRSLIEDSVLPDLALLSIWSDKLLCEIGLALAHCSDEPIELRIRAARDIYKAYNMYYGHVPPPPDIERHPSAGRGKKIKQRFAEKKPARPGIMPSYKNIKFAALPPPEQYELRDPADDPGPQAPPLLVKFPQEDAPHYPYCYYHVTYGDHAGKCRPPCCFQMPVADVCKGQLPQDCARADRFHGRQMSEAVKVEPPEESAEADTMDESQMFEAVEIKLEPPEDPAVCEPQMFEAVEVKMEPPEDPAVSDPQVFEFVDVKTEPCEGSPEAADVDVSQLQAPASAIKGANSTKTGDASAPHPSRAASAQGPKATIHCQAKKIILNVVEGGKVEKKVTWLLFPLSKPLAEYVADAPGRLNQRSSESCYITSQENVKQNVVPGELEIGAGESKSFTTFGIHSQQTEKGEEERLCGIRQKCGLREEEFNKFSCSFCLRSFPSKYRLIMHVFIHIDGVEPPTYVCKSCGEVFPSNISLVRHVKMSGHIYNHENITEETGKQSSNEETRMISRKFCNDNYNTRITTIYAGERDRHENCGSSSITGNINHRAVVPAYKCDLCGRGFSQLKNYSRHRLIHAVIPAHKCDLCGRGFAQLKHYNRHRLTHAAIRPHACNICGKSFAQKCHLRQHSLIHTGTPQHKCDICGKSFILLGNLNRHSLIHTDTKEHKCDLCGKYFREKSHLKAHLVVHSGLKPYRCGTCRKSFTQLVHLKAHSALHNKNKQDKKYT